MDLRVCPGSPEEVELTYLLHRLHIGSRFAQLMGANGTGIFGICWANSSGAAVRVNVAVCN